MREGEGAEKFAFRDEFVQSEITIERLEIKKKYAKWFFAFCPV